MPGYNKSKMSDLKAGFEASPSDYDPIAKKLASIGSGIKGLFTDDGGGAMSEALERRKQQLSGMKKEYD